MKCLYETQESQLSSHVFVLEISILHISAIFLLDFGADRTIIFFVFLLDFGTVRTMVFFVFLLDFGTVRTIVFFCFSVRFWNCSDNGIFFVFLLDFGTVRTMVFFAFHFIWWQLWNWTLVKSKFWYRIKRLVPIDKYRNNYIDISFLNVRNLEFIGKNFTI